MSKYVNVVKVKVKPSLKKLSPKLGVTDPASGSVVVKK